MVFVNFRNLESVMLSSVFTYITGYIHTAFVNRIQPLLKEGFCFLGGNCYNVTIIILSTIP